MDRREQATKNRDKAPRLNAQWNVGAVQTRFNHDGHWYAALAHFPAALFDANGYVLFETEDEYRNSPHLRIGKHISIRQPGISAIPGYVRVIESNLSPDSDVDIHSTVVDEGQRRLVMHLKRERKKSIVDKKKKQAATLDCEVCEFSFSGTYGSTAEKYCEVHHLIPLHEVKETTKTRLEDLAILCANCHRVIHLRNPPYKLEDVRAMLCGR